MSNACEGNAEPLDSETYETLEKNLLQLFDNAADAARSPSVGTEYRIAYTNAAALCAREIMRLENHRPRPVTLDL